MQDDGTFLVDVKLPWGERQAYKYVLDGEWMVREDEDKEWGESGERRRASRAAAWICGVELTDRRPLWKCEQRELRNDERRRRSRHDASGDPVTHERRLTRPGRTTGWLVCDASPGDPTPETRTS